MRLPLAVAVVVVLPMDRQPASMRKLHWGLSPTFDVAALPASLRRLRDVAA